MGLVVDARGKFPTQPRRQPQQVSGAQASFGDPNSSVLPVNVPSNPGVIPVNAGLESVAQEAQSRPMQTMPSVLPSVSVAQMPSSMPMPGLVSDSQMQPMSLSPQPIMLSGSSSPIGGPVDFNGSDQLMPDDQEKKAGLDVWEQEASKRENRPVRTANLWDEEYENVGEPLNDWDNQLSYIGNTPTNDAYVRYFIERGMPEEDAYEMTHHDRNWWENIIGGDREYAGDTEVMDDGTSLDYNHLVSDNMTGTQYRKYVANGMGGLPYDEIVPSQIYSKRAEQVNNGFIPFTPDMRSYVNMVSENVMKAPSRLTKEIGDLRQKLSPDYTINVGNESHSGRDFDRVSPAYVEGFNYESEYNPEKFLTKSSDDVTPFIKEYEVPDANGNLTYHYGGLASNENGTEIRQNDDGTYRMLFNDGTDVDVSKDYIDQIMRDGFRESGRVPINEAKGMIPEDLDSLNDIDSIMKLAKENDLSPLDYAEVMYVPDLVMPNGEHINFEDAKRVYEDSTPGDDAGESDDDISYSFSGGLLPGTDNKPQRLTKQEMLGENGWDFSDLGNNMWDWTFGSIPISVPGKLPWVGSLANGAVGLSGIDPGSYDPNTGGYSLTAGSYDKKGNLRYGVTNAEGKRDKKLSDEGRLWNALGNAAVPLTEQIAGNIGSDPLKKLLNKATGGFFELPNFPTLRQVLGNALMDMVGEGVEEDVGNIFDDLTRYGWSGAFADPVLDENGDVMRDMMGAEVRDVNTPFEQRIHNFADPEDLANSFAGGASVDLLMNALTAPLTKDNPIRQMIPAARRDAARRKTGVRQFVDPFENEEEEE